MQSRRRQSRRTGEGSRVGLALVAATLAACSPAAPLPSLGATADHAPRGAPLRPSPPPADAAATEPPPPPWELGPELRRLHPASPRTPSEHFTGQLDGEILADDGAASYPALGPLRRIETGATLVERLLPRGSPEPAAYFAMVKRPAGYDPAGGDWEYLVLDSTGRIEQRGRLPLCARCHADAPHDHLFGTGR
ncbi:MAG: hypothetical protein ABI134_34880 [Byssovorax sp.]